MNCRLGALWLAAAATVVGTAVPASAHSRHRIAASRTYVVHVRHAPPVRIVRARGPADPVAVAASTYPATLAVECAYPLYGEPYPPAGGFLSDCTEYAPPPGRALILHRAVEWTGVHYFAQFPGRTEAGFFPRAIRAQARRMHHEVVLHARY